MNARTTWKSPLHIEQVRGTSYVSNGHATVTIRIRPRRWHPAWWWLVIQHVEPRYLWRPDVWALIVWAGLTAGKGT